MGVNISELYKKIYIIIMHKLSLSLIKSEIFPKSLWLELVCQKYYVCVSMTSD